MSLAKTPKKRKKSCFQEQTRAGCTAHALAEAQEICAAKHLRLTDLRFAVLQQIWLHEKPAGAYEILAELKKDFPKAAPISIYRALDFLIENGLIHRLPSLNAYTGCCFPSEEHTAAFAVCSKCGKVEEIKADKIFKELKKAASGFKFKTKTAAVEIQGVCASCRK